MYSRVDIVYYQSQLMLHNSGYCMANAHSKVGDRYTNQCILMALSNFEVEGGADTTNWVINTVLLFSSIAKYVKPG